MLKVVHIKKAKYTDEDVRELAAIIIKKQQARERAWIKKHFGMDVPEEDEQKLPTNSPI